MIFYQGREIHSPVYMAYECTGFGNFVVDRRGSIVDKAQYLLYQVLKNVFIPECTALIVIGLL